MNKKCKQETITAQNSSINQSNEKKDYFVCNYQFLLKKMEIVHKNNSLNIPYYTLTDLNGEEEIVVGGVRVPVDMDKISYRTERVFINSIAYAVHFPDYPKSELERYKERYDIETTEFTDIYVGVDEWETADGRKWDISGSNYFVGESDGGYVLKGDGFMFENEKYSLFGA